MISASIVAFILAVFCYGIRELYYHGKLKWMKGDSSFWGIDSHVRKYNFPHRQVAPNTRYYRFFKIPYKERFPLAATLLVFVTDSQHLMQFAFKLFLILTLVTYEPVFNMVWDFIGYFALWGIVFSLTYRWLQR